MEENRMPIAILCTDLIPDVILDEIQEVANELSVDLQIEKRKSEPMATLEWFLPTVLAIYFFKPYTTAFLQEMGKDHYQSIKRIITVVASKLIGRDKVVPIKVVTSSNSPKKISGNYSVAFSALIKISEKDKIKFLFDDSLLKEELVEYAEKIADFVVNNSTESIMNIIKKNGSLHIINTSLYAYDKKTKELILLDPIHKKKNE